MMSTKDIPCSRDELVERYRPYVVSIAKQVQMSLAAARIELGDLIGYGEIGLLQAADRFDPKVGASFKTYAYYWIKGAIYDGLRTMGWMSRSEYKKLKFEEKAEGLLASHSEGAAAPHPARDSLLVEEEVDQVQEIISNLAVTYIISLDSMQGPQAMKDERHAKPDEQYELNETRRRVRNLISKLPKRERRLIEAYYYQGLTLEEIGKELGCSKSWASRLHAQSLKLLRKMMHGHESIELNVEDNLTLGGFLGELNDR